MKKLVIFTVFLAIFSLFSMSQAFSQRNSFAFGDKSESEIRASVEAFNVLIIDYDTQMKALQKENERMLAEFQTSASNDLSTSYQKRVALNDSLIMVYRLKGLELRETKQAFLEMTAGKTKKKRVSSRGNNPAKLREAANAYAMMSYVDAYTSSIGKAGGVGEVAESGLKGLIVNKHYQDLTVTVSGPGNWQMLYPISRNGGKIFFSPPSPGRYIFSFSNGRDVSSQVGYCRPGLSGACDEQGNKYDLMAIMPRGY